MSWRDSPGIVAVVAGSAATVFVVTLGFSVVIPTWLKSKDFQIEQLNRTIGGLNQELDQERQKLVVEKTKSSIEVKSLVAQRDELRKELAELESENLKLSTTNMFSKDDVYPNGLRLVRIFQPVSRLKEVYTEDQLEDSGSWYSVDTGNKVFHQATYYYREYKGHEFITHILFHASEKYHATDFIYEKLVEKYGSKSAERVEVGNDEEWHFKNVLDHYLKVGERTYVIKPILPEK